MCLKLFDVSDIRSDGVSVYSFLYTISIKWLLVDRNIGRSVLAILKQKEKEYRMLLLQLIRGNEAICDNKSLLQPIRSNEAICENKL